MAAQLTCDPIIKITLTSNEVFDEVAPGYVCDSFRLTKGLLKPNKFEFVLRKEELTLEPADIDFELRDMLLAAKVEVDLKARKYDEKEDALVEYDVNDFFYGYIQNIKVYRENSKPMTFKCVAYSPDAKMKHHPTCKTFSEYSLKGCVEFVTSMNVTEPMMKYDREKGKYEGEGDFLRRTIDPVNYSDESMPYTVQYHESPYNFLKRLARRYAEFMYYENREFIFGKMKELPEIRLHNGTDLAKYSYELNMNDHNGITFAMNDPIQRVWHTVHSEKRNGLNDDDMMYDYMADEGYTNDLALSAYRSASDYFGDYYNTVEELGNSPCIEENLSNLPEDNPTRNWLDQQRQILDHYVLSDSLICTGEADRVDLKLGSVLVIEDNTKSRETKEELKEQKPLKVIELSYYWNKEKYNLDVKNWFKAIPLEAMVPPYMERDKDGFLIYGDFDLYPKSGPHYGMVVDNIDPEHLGRVKVMLMWQGLYGRHENGESYEKEIWGDKSNTTPWIWVVSSLQGNQRGALFVPEIGDQVLVGYECNNVERPYVMGSRWSMNQMPKEWSSYQVNNVKGFRTRSGHTIEFIDNDDSDNLSSQGGKIHIYDAKTHNYDITLNTDRGLVRINCAGNIEMNAGNNIVFHAGNDIIASAGNDMETMVGHDKRSTVENNQMDRIKGTRNANITMGEEVFADEYYIMGVHTNDEGDEGSRIVLNDELLYASFVNPGSNSESMLLLNKDGGQLATNIPRAVASVKSVQGETEVSSDTSNVTINSKMNIEMNAEVEAEISGKMVKIN